MIVMIFLIGLSVVSVAYADEYMVEIPFGAFNPELNTPAQVWYDPPKIIINVGDVVKWNNADREGHTITSGHGSGRFGWMSDNFGEKSDIFDSMRIMPNESWSFSFDEAGEYAYFCTIHPWMEGIVIVKTPIPDLPHDAAGKVLEFPTLQYTPDRDIEINLSWDPPVIKTHEKIQFVYQFYDPKTNSNLANMNYDFVIFQNGKEVFRDTGVNQIGGDFRNFVFAESGSIIIRFEAIKASSIFTDQSVTVTGDIETSAQRSADFTAVVYENVNTMTHDDYEIKPAQRLAIYYELALLFIFIPGVLFILALLWLKKKPKISERKADAI